MCGRYVSKTEAAMERAFNLLRVYWQNFESYNVAPSQQVPMIRMNDGEREGMLVRWGLVPFFCRGEPPKYSTINARVETIHTSPAYRGAWKRGQRCIFPVLGFYEWQVRGSGKQPFFIHVADRPWFGIAGLWDSSIKADGTIVSLAQLLLCRPRL
jgi:putative SOS response-associated peptidase YedK